MGGWGLLIQEGHLFDVGAYLVENTILVRARVLWVLNFYFSLHWCRVFPLKSNIIIINNNYYYYCKLNDAIDFIY